MVFSTRRSSLSLSTWVAPRASWRSFDTTSTWRRYRKNPASDCSSHSSWWCHETAWKFDETSRERVRATVMSHELSEIARASHVGKNDQCANWAGDDPMEIGAMAQERQKGQEGQWKWRPGAVKPNLNADKERIYCHTRGHTARSAACAWPTREKDQGQRSRSDGQDEGQTQQTESQAIGRLGNQKRVARSLQHLDQPHVGTLQARMIFAQKRQRSDSDLQ